MIKKSKAREVELLFTESMGALLSAGLSIQDAVSVCSQINGDKNMANLCAELKESVLGGESFHKSLSHCAIAFSPLYISLVKIGEATGSAQKVFQKLSGYLKQKKEIRQKIIQALAYPVTVCVTAVAIGFFIILFVMPRLSTVFEVFQTNDGEQSSMNNLTSISNNLYYIVAVFFFIAAIITVCIKLKKSSRTFSMFVDSVLLKVPALGNVIKSFCVSDFAFSMEMLCVSGISLINAIDQSKDVVSNIAFRNEIGEISEDITNGFQITQAFKRHPVFPDYVTSWIGIGERTGSVEKVFSQIHSYYEHESTELVTSLVSILEPAFILLAGSFIILLVWRFVLPVFSLIGGL
jgi:type II secretory pathway component PulF